MRIIRVELGGMETLIFQDPANAYAYICALNEMSPLKEAKRSSCEALRTWLESAPAGAFQPGYYEVYWISILDLSLLDEHGKEPEIDSIVDNDTGDFEEFMQSRGFVFISEPKWTSRTRAHASTRRAGGSHPSAEALGRCEEEI